MNSSPSRPRRRLQWQDRALLILASFLLALLILRIETASAQAPHNEWGLQRADGQKSVALDTDIQVQVDGLAARVQVTQWFQNTGGEWAEAIYRYPLPPGAAVDEMRIEAGQRVIIGTRTPPSYNVALPRRQLP